MNRGEIRWLTFRAPDKRRPVLILTRTSALDMLSDISVAPITGTVRRIGSEVELDADDGMSGRCVINFDRVQTVARDRIAELIATLDAERLPELEDALMFAYGLGRFAP